MTHMKRNAVFPIVRSYSCDVLVVGGGTTGIAAALSARRHGAETLLVESQGFTGGNAVAISSWMGFYTPSGVKVVDGIAGELIRRLRENGAATPDYPDPICGSLTVVNPVALKIVSAAMLEASGVRTMLHTRFVGVRRENGAITGAYLLACEGMIEIRCGMAIDATESGVLLREASETLHFGRASDGKSQVSSWSFTVGCIDFDKLFAYFEQNPDQIRPFPLLDSSAHFRQIRRQDAFVAGAFSRLIKRARADGMEIPRDNMPGVFYPASKTFMTVATRVENVDPSRSEAMTKAEFEGMSQVRIFLEFLRTYVPGFRNCTLESSNTTIGIRETSHLDGVYTLCAEDLLSGKSFHDAVALGGYHLDIHSPDHGGLETRMPPVYSIPFRALLPKQNTNLLAAGRTISATQAAQASVRVIPISMAIGEAAGCAAAIALDAAIPVPCISVELLRRKLRDSGAIVDLPERSGLA